MTIDVNTVLTDMELLEALETAKVGLADYQALCGRLEQQVFQRMDASGATSIPNANADGEKVYICEKEETYGYSPDEFSPLKEIFNTADLLKCFTFEHQEMVTIEAKWKAAGTIKKVAKEYGTKALDIVERARFLKGTSLKFERVK